MTEIESLIYFCSFINKYFTFDVTPVNELLLDCY